MAELVEVIVITKLGDITLIMSKFPSSQDWVM